LIWFILAVVLGGVFIGSIPRDHIAPATQPQITNPITIREMVALRAQGKVLRLPQLAKVFHSPDIIPSAHVCGSAIESAIPFPYDI
jgi:hypothetical protein